MPPSLQPVSSEVYPIAAHTARRPAGRHTGHLEPSTPSAGPGRAARPGADRGIDWFRPGRGRRPGARRRRRSGDGAAGHHVSTTTSLAGVHLSIGEALLVALILALVRLVLQLVVAWLPSRISADVQSQMRHDLFDAFTRASWPAQANKPEGHLQELMTDQIMQATQAVISVANALSAVAMFVALLISAFLLNALAAVLVLASAILLFSVSAAHRPSRTGGRGGSLAGHYGPRRGSKRIGPVGGGIPGFRRRRGPAPPRGSTNRPGACGVLPVPADRPDGAERVPGIGALADRRWTGRCCTSRGASGSPLWVPSCSS